MNIPNFFNSIAQGLNSITDSYIKFLIRALLTLIVIAVALLIGYTAYSLFQGKHTKLRDGEFNIPDSSKLIKLPSDTQILSDHTISDRDKPKPNTTNKPATTYSKSIIQAASPSNKLPPTNTTTRKQDTVKQNIKYNITAPVTQSAVGDNATNINNYNGIKPRQLNDAEKLDIISAIRILIERNKHWGKNPMINFNLPVSDNESLNYAEQINVFLFANGYDRIMNHNVMYGGRRFGNYGIKKDTISSTSYISISIYPQSNINP